MKCVVYSKKVSVLKDETSVSIKEQNDRLRAFATENDLEIDAYYEDKSDDPNAEKGFEALKQDGIAGKISLVILESVFRCGTGVAPAKFLLLETFYIAGIHFIITDDSIDSRKSDYETLKNYFNSRIMQVSARNHINRCRNEVTNKRSIPPLMECYGYRLSEDRKSIVIDEYAAEIINQIFSMLNSGMNHKQIIKYLDEKNIENPGKYTHRVCISKPDTITQRWTKSCIDNIRRNIKYTGCDMDTVFGKITYPRIVEPDVFEKLKEQAANNTKTRDIYDRYFNPFSSIVFFGENNEKLILRTVDGRKDESYFRLRNGKKKIIGFYELYDAVKKTVLSEKERAVEILKMLESEGSFIFKEKIREEYRDKSAALFEKSKEIAALSVKVGLDFEKGMVSERDYYKKNESLDEQQKKYNESFKQIIDEIDRRIKKLNKKNKWLSLYSSLDENGTLDRTTVRKIIEKIIVNADGSVETILKTPGKEAFPV